MDAQGIELFCRFASGLGSRSEPIGTLPMPSHDTSGAAFQYPKSPSGLSTCGSLEAHHGARIARPISDRRAAIPGAKSGTGSVQCSEAALIAVNTRRQGGSKTKHLGLEMSATITPHPVTHLMP
jgi:hypothetical protein